MGGRRRVFATWVPLRKKRIELSGSPGSELLTITRKMPKGETKKDFGRDRVGNSQNPVNVSPHIVGC